MLSLPYAFAKLGTFGIGPALLKYTLQAIMDTNAILARDSLLWLYGELTVGIEDKMKSTAATEASSLGDSNRSMPPLNMPLLDDGQLTFDNVIIDDFISSHQSHSFTLERHLSGKKQFTSSQDKLEIGSFTSARSKEDPQQSLATPNISKLNRSLLSTALFWSAGLFASLVNSVDVVWDLLGSTLTLMIGFLIPIAAFLVARDNSESRWKVVTGYLLFIVYVPTMIVCTVNAVRNVFF